MGKDENKGEIFLCPVGRFFSDLEKVTGKKSTFFGHLTRSRVEFLKAMRSLIDEKIEGLEKRPARKAAKKVTKIKVE